LQSPFATILELQRYPAEALEIQPLTPHYGYDVPELIEEADLSDTFQKCFDLSLELYSALQAAGHQREAQYATLCGHVQRWKLTHNAVQARQLQQISQPSPYTQKLLTQLHQKMTEAHPTIAEF
jgi:hypothetical protein